MAIKPEEALEIVGIDVSKYETTDDLRTAFEAEWVKMDRVADNAKAREMVIGKVNRVASTRLGGIVKDFELDVDPEVLKKDPLDIIAEVSKALKPKFEEIKTLREKAEKAVPDDVLNDLKGKLESKDKEVSTFKTQAAEYQKKYDDLNLEITTKDRNAKVNADWDAAYKGIEWNESVDELKREGFDAKSRKKYKVEVQDDGNTRLLDAKGEPVSHPKKAGEYLSLTEALKRDADELGLTKKNPHAGKKVERKATSTTMDDVPGRTPREVYIAEPVRPNMRKR